MCEELHLECKYHEREFDDFGSYDICYNPKSHTQLCRHCVNAQEKCPMYVKGRTVFHIKLED
jgi:hypothetical protein